ncbi:hypothetical protein AB0E11_13315 [Streptomyces fradiae]|uniref:hypothetical protein n=1 Tax=Streptomyces fradiae TaxID=1906 RepID=UPI0033CDEE16
MSADTPGPASPPPSPSPRPSSPRPPSARRLRRRSLLWALVLVPVWLGAWLVPLSTERGTACVMADPVCGALWPEGTLQFALAAVVIACCTVLVAPDRGARNARVRRVAYRAQLLFSCVAVLWVLTWAV